MNRFFGWMMTVMICVVSLGSSSSFAADEEPVKETGIREEAEQAAGDLGKLAAHLNEYQSKLKTLLKESGYGTAEEKYEPWDPQMESEADGEAMIYRFHLKGVKPEDLAARIRNSRNLELLGIHETEGTFQKTVNLPDRALAGGGKAVWDKETLTVTLPRDRRFVRDEVETLEIVRQ